MTRHSLLLNLGAGLALLAAAPAAQAITVNIDGLSSPTLLSDAIGTVMTSPDVEKIINIEVDSLPDPDSQILINKPVTINGDADGNGVPCDILVGITQIDPNTVADVGRPDKWYMEIEADGEVNINNLKIHPNADSRTGPRRVSGIVAYKPESGHGVYTLEKVFVSGSDDSNNYIDLGTGNDLYAGSFKGFAGVGDAASSNANYAGVQVSNGGGAGTYDITLKNCHVGLSRSSAVNIYDTGGEVKILGGLFGHSRRDGISINSANNVSIQGTQDNRVRVVRVPNEAAKDAHGIEIVVNSSLNVLEYTDISASSSGNGLKVGNSTITDMRFCRFMEKSGGGSNQVVYLQTGTTFTNPITDCTFVGSGTHTTPFFVHGNISGTMSLKDSIFVSRSATAVIQANNDNPGTGPTPDGIQGFDYCAIPEDGLANETLLVGDPIQGSGESYFPAPTNSVSVSPQFMLNLPEYDWSDNQGAGDTLNGPGNANVYRPSNPAYDTASSTGGKLTGGAGADTSSVRDWMLMEL